MSDLSVVHSSAENMKNCCILDTVSNKNVLYKIRALSAIFSLSVVNSPAKEMKNDLLETTLIQISYQ